MDLDNIKDMVVNLTPQEQDSIITEILKNRNNRISTPIIDIQPQFQIDESKE